MDAQLISIHYSDPLWIAIAFVCGLTVKNFGLPPLVGFLFAGFVLNGLGAKDGEFLGILSDMGITLLLFSIGLKLKLSSLARPEVWGTATLHMGLVTLIFGILVMLLSYTSVPLFHGMEAETALLIAFAMTFSSTVFAVKVLDESGTNNALHGQTSIGVLVIQDIAAVIFIAVSMGKIPSLWTVTLILLIPMRFIFYKILDKVGHGELLILFGISMALIGADLFELVGMKGDVGALVFGMLLAKHSKSTELAKALLGFKELFLVGFFLSVGMTAMPSGTDVLIALLLMLFLPLKVAIYFGLFSLFNLRSNSAWRASLNLANYSEFGLIVGAIAVSSGWLAGEWLAILALILAFSFILSAPIISIRDSLYERWRTKMNRFERKNRLAGEEHLALSHIKAVVFGMGRMGVAAYNALEKNYAGNIAGVEVDRERATRLTQQGRNVYTGDVTNPDFWIRAPELHHDLEWVLLTLPNHQANMNSVLRLKEMGYQGRIAATAKHHDEEDELKALGVDHTFNIYTVAGLGFANELESFLSK
ncbi:Glutathione-regulated potassium-efflux system protein KefC [Vibrio aerogenes CECT 7868]|uniref:Glutathione-regulated potassium-efflux system protein KefC n=1 Tax=Vibrio aerogenes CECT 7868 TaxID=1216006 RepID=A0A1M5XEG6_9VIBR|nr:cation:proton antiporter family protein [Vibrio aerogenes]SHH98191.1 Glutathione-regulated potassium-efflux system protein KefC [Vibrio aerogenes CECT 7868]